MAELAAAAVLAANKEQLVAWALKLHVVDVGGRCCWRHTLLKFSGQYQPGCFREMLGDV